MLDNKNVQRGVNQKTPLSTVKPSNSTTTGITRPSKLTSTASAGLKTTATKSSGTSGPFKKQAPPPEEEKKEVIKTGLYTTKPSAKLTSIKTADPFAPKTNIKK